MQKSNSVFLCESLEICFSCHILVIGVQVIAIHPMWALHFEFQVTMVEDLVKVGYSNLQGGCHLCIKTSTFRC